MEAEEKQTAKYRENIDGAAAAATAGTILIWKSSFEAHINEL